MDQMQEALSLLLGKEIRLLPCLISRFNFQFDGDSPLDLAMGNDKAGGFMNVERLDGKGKSRGLGWVMVKDKDTSNAQAPTLISACMAHLIDSTLPLGALAFRCGVRGGFLSSQKFLCSRSSVRSFRE